MVYTGETVLVSGKTLRQGVRNIWALVLSFINDRVLDKSFILSVHSFYICSLGMIITTLTWWPRGLDEMMNAKGL